jgi:hypothetical protein
MAKATSLCAPVVVLAALAGLVACGGPPKRKPLEMEHIGTFPNLDRTPPVDTSDRPVTAPNSAVTPTPTPGREGSACSGTDLDGIEEAVKSCEAPMPKNADLATKDKIEIRVTTSTPQITPGGRVDVTVVFRNKSNGPVSIYFTGDPVPRFDVEAQDAKGRRADQPAGKQPPWPKGSGSSSRDVKAAKFTIDKGGTAKLRIPWDAVKTKWAPEKVKTWEGRGFPRAPSGPLAAGRYTLIVKMPLLNDIDVPKVPIEVGG